MNNFLILDTETTGLDESAEIVEITIIDNLGNTLLDTLVKPKKPITKEVSAIHGITNKDVENAPTFDLLHSQICAILNNQTCFIYNSQYDVRILKQTAKLYDLDFNINTNFECAMLPYSKFNNEWNEWHGNYKWVKLTSAYDKVIKLQNKEKGNFIAHRALGDCHMTLEVINFLKGKNLL